MRGSRDDGCERVLRDERRMAACAWRMQWLTRWKPLRCCCCGSRPLESLVCFQGTRKVSDPIRFPATTSATRPLGITRQPLDARGKLSTVTTTLTGEHMSQMEIPPPLTGPPPSQHVPTTTYNRFPGRRETRTAGRQWMARTSGFIRLRGWRMVRCRIARCVIPGGYLLLTVWHWRRRWSGQRRW